MKFGIGFSKKKEAEEVGREATEEALSSLGEKPDLLILFSSSLFEMERLLSQVSLSSNHAPLIGTSTAGEITNRGISFGSLIVVAVKCEDGEKITTFAVRDINENPRIVGSKIPMPEEMIEGSLLLFLDGLVSHGTAVVKSVYSGLDPRISVVGSAAGDDLRRQKTYQYYNGEILTNSLVGGFFFTNVHTKTALRHGFYPQSPPMRVTKSAENVIYEIDNHRATKVYLECLGLSEDEIAYSPVADLKETKVAPIGIPQMSGDYLIKHFIDFERDGAITCDSWIPQNSIIRIMAADKGSLIKAAKECAAEVARCIRRPKMLFVFACTTRMVILGEDAEKEIEVIKEAFPEGIPIAGFYGYGEIGPLSGRRSEFNNKSMVIWAIE